MTTKELKKLNRRQLLELLIAQTDRADELQQQIEVLEQKLQNRMIAQTDAGSIAEASLKLNGVFESAQAAAAQYLENIENQAQLCKRIEEESRTKANKILADTERVCQERERKAQENLAVISAKMQSLYEQFRVLEAAFGKFKVNNVEES